MKYNVKHVETKGKHTLLLSIHITDEELELINKIADDCHVTIESVMVGDYDMSLAYARTLCYWASVAERKDNMQEYITQCAKARKLRNKKNVGKGRKQRKRKL